VSGDAKIRVLLAEDSPSQRELMAWALADSGEFEVVGCAVNGMEAVEMTAALRPDIVLMDCHMPVLDGIGATREIMRRCPVPILVASASFAPTDVHPGLEAVREGALAIVPKLPGVSSANFDAVARELFLTLRLMSEVKVVRRLPPRARREVGARTEVSGRIRIVALGASTGGPPVILEILRGLGSNFSAPVLVVQHMANGFTRGFASWLARGSGLPVEIASDATLALPGHVYVGPEGCHLGINRQGRLTLSDDPPKNGFRPSVSHLFHAVAEAFGPCALAVLLTGMGDDGAEGLADVARYGGITVAQDRETSVVFGMPAAALKLGAAQRLLAPADMAQFIQTQMARKSLST
jgi:two-component system chemotaxis response regulator CheB